MPMSAFSLFQFPSSICFLRVVFVTICVFPVFVSSRNDFSLIDGSVGQLVIFPLYSLHDGHYFGNLIRKTWFSEGRFL